MGKIIDFKDINNWDELFDMTFDLMSFLVEEEKIKPDLIIKTTYNIIHNAGYGYTQDDVRKKYFSLEVQE